MAGVYILIDPETNWVKIGRATNFDERLANLRTANPRLRPLHWIETEHESRLESHLHGVLAPHRREGEFFDVDPAKAFEEATWALDQIAQWPDEEDLELLARACDLLPARPASDSEIAILRQLLEVRAELKRLTLLEDTLLKRIAHAIGNNEGLDSWATYRITNRRSFDVQAFQQVHPDLATEFTRESASRTLRVQPFIR